MAKQKQSEASISMPVVNPHAAGIDVGGKFHAVCVNQEEVKEFGVFTEDLHHLAEYLKSHGIKTVAMESTGYHWKPLFVLLQDYSFEVILVNARHIKNVKGRKTDVVDSKWLQQLHSLGLLSASFQLDNFTEELRNYTRQRRYLIEQRTRFVNRVHAALVQMNIHLGRVMRDVMGKSGQAIIEAILAGERNPEQLASLADKRLKASPEQVAAALEGHWREDKLFEVKQNWDAYKFLTKQLAECDAQIEELLKSEVAVNAKELSGYEGKKKSAQKNDPGFEVAPLFYHLTGVDATAIGGVGADTVLSLFSEVGWDFSKFPSEHHFSSWLGLAPNVKKSSGRIYSSKTEKKRNRAATALKHAANAIGNSPQHELYGFFKSQERKKGRKYAITATAHKLAIIIYKMITKQEPYNYMPREEYEQLQRQRQLRKVQRLITRQGFSLEELGLAQAV